jgi:hypothetical protein
MQQEAPTTAKPDRDLDEVLLSLEVELFGPPKKSRERDDQTVVIRTPPPTRE